MGQPIRRFESYSFRHLFRSPPIQLRRFAFAFLPLARFLRPPCAGIPQIMSDMTIVAIVMGAAFLAWAFIAYTFKERREHSEREQNPHNGSGPRDRKTTDPGDVRS